MNFSHKLSIAAFLLSSSTMALPESEDPQADGRAARMEKWDSWSYGLFIHWGPYSRLGGTYQGQQYRGNTEWIMQAAKISRQDYRKAAADFDPKHYDPVALVSFAKQCGFKYIILTAKHYDGFSLFDSKVSDFDAVDVLPSKRDLLREFSIACAEAKMPLGLSYSIEQDWYHPGGDPIGGTWDISQKGSRSEYIEKIALPQVKELLSNYGTVPLMMFGNGSPMLQPIASQFQDAIGPGIITARAFTESSQGDYFYSDGAPLGPNEDRKSWEQCISISDSWGFRHEPSKWKSSKEIIQSLVSTASRGGNFLLNVGLDGDGQFTAQARERLSTIGGWLSQHGKSIYETENSPFPSHPWSGAATLRNDGTNDWKMYLQLFQIPADNIYLPNLLTQPLGATLMGTQKDIPIMGRAGAWKLDLTNVDLDGLIPVIEIKFTSRPVLGVSPIVEDVSGNFQLEIGRATISGPGMSLGRTPSASDLRINGFVDELGQSKWEIYVERAGNFRLDLRCVFEPESQSKKLQVSLNGDKGRSFEAAPLSSGSGSLSSSSPIQTFESPPVQLSTGLNHVTLSGVADDGDPRALTVLSAALLKN